MTHLIRKFGLPTKPSSLFKSPKSSGKAQKPNSFRKAQKFKSPKGWMEKSPARGSQRLPFPSALVRSGILSNLGGGCDCWRPNHAWTWTAHALRHGLRHGSDESQRRQIQSPSYSHLHHQRLLRPRHWLLLRMAILCSRFLRIFSSRRHPSPCLLHPHSGSSSLPLLRLALLCSTPQGPSRFRLWGESFHSIGSSFRRLGRF